MSQCRDIPALLAAFRAGDPEAGTELYARCAPFIRAVVRCHLHAGLRARFDSLDFVQDVWASFLACGRCEFATAKRAKAFLARVAYNKVIEMHRRRFGTQKCDIAREVPAWEVGPEDEPPARLPTPSQWAIAGEAWERLLGLIPPGHRAIVERMREGHRLDDVARMTGVSVSTVNRVVRRLKDLTGL